MTMRPFSFFKTLMFAFLGFLAPLGTVHAATVTVTSTGDTIAVDGLVTLREAITSINNGANLNADVVADTTNGGYGTNDIINFAIAGGGLHTISAAASLPQVIKKVTIDGYSQSGSSINTNGTDQGLNTVLTIEIKDTSGVFANDLLTLGAASDGSRIRGLVLNGADGNQLVVGSSSNGTVVEGNFFGTDASGTSSAATGIGLAIVGASDVVVGGTTPAARNLISGNGDVGLFIGGDGATGITVAGNLIGTDKTGLVELGNANVGIRIVDFGGSPTGNTIGGTTPAARNIISGNDGIGVEVSGSGVMGNIIQGNFIGTDVTGTQKLANGFLGISIQDAPNNLIGGPVFGAGNVISGNDSSGIQIDGDTATGNQILGNYIGTDVTGTVNLANNSNGIGIGSGSTVIGGTTPEARNLIINGINLFLGSTDTVIQGNFIGTDVTGTQSLGSVSGGIFIFTTNNTIGGTAPGAGNVIAFNPDFGIATAPNAGPGNTILGNSIFANDGLGIDLLQDGITANDAGDGDTGPNNLQNFPVLSSAVSANGSTTIQGTLDSTAGGNFRIEFFSNVTCDPSVNGEGQTFLGAVDAPNGNFNAVLPVSLNALSITATATDNATKDTSEFSACLQATILVEDCSNGTDDDGDQLADCDDPDCAAIPACVPVSEICDNGIDDDGDNLLDCDDPDCATNPVCSLAVSGGGCELTPHSTSREGFATILFSLLILFGMGLRRSKM